MNNKSKNQTKTIYMKNKIMRNQITESQAEESSLETINFTQPIDNNLAKKIPEISINSPIKQKPSSKNIVDKKESEPVVNENQVKI